MSEWQKIKTAPKDGTPLILAYRSLGVVYGVYDHIGTADWWITKAVPHVDMEWTQHYLDTGEDPTHWMPLPDPP